MGSVGRSSGKEIHLLLIELKTSLPSSKQPTSVPSTDSTANIHTISANLSNNHFTLSHMCVLDSKYLFAYVFRPTILTQKPKEPSSVLQINDHSRTVTCLKDITGNTTQVSAKLQEFRMCPARSVVTRNRIRFKTREHSCDIVY